MLDFAQQERKGRARDPWPDPNTKGVWAFDFAQHERKGREGKGRAYLVGRRSLRRRTGKGGVTPLSSPRRRLERRRPSEPRG